MPRRRRGLWIRLLFLAGIVLGTACGLWLRDWLAEQMTVYRALFFMQLSQAGIPDWTYFAEVFRARSVLLCLLFLAAFAGWYGKVIGCLGFAVGFWCGVLIFGLTSLEGISGFFLFGAAVLPHFLFYGFGCILLHEFSHKKDRFRSGEQVWIAMQIAAVFLAGIVCESWIQPYILKWIGVR